MQTNGLLVLHYFQSTHLTQRDRFYSGTSPTVRAGMLNNGTDSGRTKKCPRGPDRRRSAAVGPEYDVAHDIELRAVWPLAGLSCVCGSVLALRRSSISCCRRARPARSMATSGIDGDLLDECLSTPNLCAMVSVRLINSGSVPLNLMRCACLIVPSTDRSGPTIGPTRYPFTPGI